MSTRPSTGSTVTRVIGIAALIALALLLCAAFWWSEPDAQQGDAVRLFYLHVPVAILEYVAFIIAGVGSVMYLWKRSVFGDVMAHAAAEVGVVFCALTLITGSLWGRPTWGTYWDWGDVRLVTTLILLLLFVGYLALRQVPGDRHTRSKQAAIVALVALIDIPIINRSVEWWANRTLHQRSTLIEGKIEDINAFATFLGFLACGLVLSWFLVHRFRVAWLEREVATHGLERALSERRAEGAEV
ncbi:MAG: cytochrome c biogenesis protein [Acidimicrobiia bacterium]|nr:cytochrome c biogenesis protein [Acidimicrobiia bacterium]MDH5238102.1 cytochrome c biogenesis protein [Acidimicrobiia bacterium]